MLDRQPEQIRRLSAYTTAVMVIPTLAADGDEDEDDLVDVPRAGEGRAGGTPALRRMRPLQAIHDLAAFLPQ